MNPLRIHFSTCTVSPALLRPYAVQHETTGSVCIRQLSCDRRKMPRSPFNAELRLGYSDPSLLDPWTPRNSANNAIPPTSETRTTNSRMANYSATSMGIQNASGAAVASFQFFHTVAQYADRVAPSAALAEKCRETMTVSHLEVIIRSKDLVHYTCSALS